MSSKKSEKSLECHVKYFHLKKKSTKRKLFALSSAQCLDKDLQITADP